MPIADYATYTKMLDNAYNNGFAYPAINCTSMMTINAAINAFAEMKTDGIIQFSTGAGTFASGRGVADSVELFASLSDYGAEGTGIYFSPHDPKTLYVNIQHSKEQDGDGTWAISNRPAQAAK